MLLMCLNLLKVSMSFGVPPLRDQKMPFAIGEKKRSTSIVTKIESIPHHALIVYGGFYCSGSLIKSQIILSAASCFLKRNNQNIVVKLGANTMTEPGQVIPAIDLKLHEYFDHNTNWNNDIALLVLKVHVKFSEYTKKIQLIEPGTSLNAGIRIEVSGWSYSERRLFDNGGGAVCNDELVGVVSFGAANKKQPYVAVLTNISYYREWIELNSQRFLKKYCHLYERNNFANAEYIVDDDAHSGTSLLY
ncbi:unnamed protein product [Chilo suppressalis]|uniref:Peptidase S1 domain-containing protein n=1 Tax=Chilo suppressalis TaxID=168631 RepID=A0ABN8BB28_CHISP|nr:unnamed protein product [Chilo suppressalis]